jgi:hypothetical protein
MRSSKGPWLSPTSEEFCVQHREKDDYFRAVSRKCAETVGAIVISGRPQTIDSGTSRA